MTPTISFYKNVKQIETKETVLLDIFLDAVKSGKWQDEVLRLRLIQDADQRRAAKSMMPNVTISGVFGKRVDKDCKLHSGVIAIDLDDLGSEVEATKVLLSQDPYVYAAFVSVGGKGLCALFKIDPEKHREAFEGIADYLIKKYQLIVDPTGVNPSRTRFVSYDPYLFQNIGALQFKKYLTKPKKRKITASIFVKNEFEDIISQMVHANVSCVEDYRDWRDIAFGLADQFGEAGRGYFHQLSSCSQKYEPSMCDRQYTHAIKRNGKGGNKITIATIYYFAKQAGINIASSRTKKIAAATSTMKKSGLDAKTIAENLKKFEGIEDADDIIQQAFESNVKNSESLVENVRMWLRHNYDLKRNVITRKLENNSVVLDEIDVNTMFLDCKILFDNLTDALFYKVLFSHNTIQYNPLTDWFEYRQDIYADGTIDSFFSAFNTPDDIVYFGKKWLVSIISSVYGEHSPLMLILAGEAQGTGKTEAFRRLLPKELRPYYAESKLDAGKDDEILMTQKLIIMDDEMGGKNKKESKRLKEMTSKQTFTLREPYGKMNVDLNRLAVLCGTTNDLAILNDPTGNRRLLPMEITSIDFEKYNAIDKESLFIEAWHLYKNGFEWQLSKEDVARLGGKTEKFEEYSKEYELIQKYFELPKTYSVEMTATEILIMLRNKSGQTDLSIKKLGSELKRLGFEQKGKMINYKRTNVYLVVERISINNTEENEIPGAEETPF